MFTKITKTKRFSMFIALAFVTLAFGISKVDAVENIMQSENSFELCHDGVDNNDNLATDMADADCADFATDPEAAVAILVAPVTENSFALCHDGIDNDDNLATDMADANCVNYANAPEEENTSSSSSNRRNGGSKKKVPTGNLSSGEVLGATTDEGSCLMLTSYMREGQINDIGQVKMLQSFLNMNLGISLPTTGFFGALTHKAVDDFQLKYKEEVLKPWVDLGLHSSINVPTGYVYKTTTYKINKLLCPDAEIAAPVLN